MCDEHSGIRFAFCSLPFWTPPPPHLNLCAASVRWDGWGLAGPSVNREREREKENNHLYLSDLFLFSFSNHACLGFLKMQGSVGSYQNNFTVASISLIWGNGILPARRCFDFCSPIGGALCTVLKPPEHVWGSRSLVVSHPVFVPPLNRIHAWHTCAQAPPHPVQEASFLVNVVS